MKYLKLFTLFPVYTLASFSNFARPSSSDQLQAPGEGYLDDIDNDFSYVDNEEEIIDQSSVHSVARRQTEYGDMSMNGFSQEDMANTMAALGTTMYGATTPVGTDGSSNDSNSDDGDDLTPEDFQRAQEMNMQPQYKEPETRSGYVDSNTEKIQVIKSIEQQASQEITNIQQNSETPEHVKSIKVQHYETAVNIFKDEYNMTDAEFDKKINSVNIALQAVDAVARSQQNNENSMFRNSNKPKCRKGQEINEHGQCEAVLPLNLNYGCWCHADNTDIFKGKGQHVDEFDKACKMYKQCLRCVRHDARNDGEVCDPGTVRYSTENHRSRDGIHMECSRSNADAGNCAINTCCCEVEYVRTVLRLFVFEGVKLDSKKYHNKFDHEAKCQGKEGNGHANDCCGHYPQRRMYNTQGKQCCHNTSVFDPYTHVCCDDGSSADSVENCGSPVRKRKRRSMDERRRKLFS